MDSSETAVSTYREEPDSVLAQRGRLHLDLARELPRTALELALTGGSVVVDCSAAEFLDSWVIQILLALKLALERGAGSLRIRGESGAGLEAPGAAPRKRRKSARKPVL